MSDTRAARTAIAGASTTPLARAARLAGTGCLAVLAACAAPAQGRLPPAPETAAERAVAQHGDDWVVIGKRLLNAGEHELAVKAFERSLLSEGPNAEALTGAGIAAEAQGLLTMAARYFERARERAPDSVVAHNNLGVVLLRLGDYYPAHQAFQAAFALSDGRSELALRNLRQSEELIAVLEGRRDEPDPEVNARVERLGSSEFRLVAWDPPGTPDEGVDEAAGEDEAAGQDEDGAAAGMAPPGGAAEPGP